MLTLLLIGSAFAGDGWTAVLPFGVSLYLHDRPVRGVAYSATQAAGLATTVTAQVLAGQHVDAGGSVEDAEYLTLQLVSGVGVGVAGASYIVSIIDGSRLHQLEAEGAARADAVRAWDRALAAREDAR